MVKSDFNKNIAIAIIFVVCIFFLWKSGILYSHSLFPVIKENRLHIFADWAMPVKLAICHKLGFNIFYPSSCMDYPFNYGNIFLYIPYSQSFEKFYFFYFPAAICFLFVYSIVSLIKPKNFFEYFLLILIIFAPSSLLVIERANTDILIFLFIVLMVYSNSSTLNFAILTLISLAKYYPVALMVNFFIEKKRSIKQIIIILLLFTLTIAFFFYLTGENLQLIQHKMKVISPTWGNQFSIRAFALISNKLVNYNYILILLMSYIFFTIFTIIFFQFFKKINFINKIDIYSLEERLFILSGNLIFLVYLVTDNVHYREIFLILFLPFVMKLKNTFENKIFKYLLYFIMFRYIFFIISNYFVFFKKYFYLLYFKAFFDLIIVSFFAAMCFIINIEILKKISLNKTKNFIKNKKI